jgi:RimJ/RimL family protein N-acetyltransferase
VPGFPAFSKPAGDDAVMLREWHSHDRDALVEMASDEAIERRTRVPSPYTARDAEEWLAPTRGTRVADHQAAFAIVSTTKGSELLGGRFDPAMYAKLRGPRAT